MNSASIHYLVSTDGTCIGYRKTGSGEPLIIIHGAGRISQNYQKLSDFLSSFFTVYVYDRRGRGLSGPATADHSIQKEIEDLQVLLYHTKARYVFGHSFGALVALQAALSLPFKKIAVYEPPVASFPDDWLPEFESLLSKNKKVKAMAIFLKAIPPPQIKRFPTWLLVALIQMIRLLERGKQDEAKMLNLLNTVPPDIKIVKQLEASVDNYKKIQAQVCLMCGSNSQLLFQNSVQLLNTSIPHSTNIIFDQLDHYSPEQLVEPIGISLRKFFLEE